MELAEIVKHYQDLFVGKTCRVFTRYHQLPAFDVFFELTDLPHLLGLHKVTSEYATLTLPKIISGEWSLDTFRTHRNFKEFEKRVNIYGFLTLIFIDEDVDYCVVRKDIASNSMNLDIVFFEGENRTVKVLGLRKDDGFYKPVTLHEASYKRYAKLRKTSIKGFEWQ